MLAEQFDNICKDEETKRCSNENYKKFSLKMNLLAKKGLLDKPTYGIAPLDTIGRSRNLPKPARYLSI